MFFWLLFRRSRRDRSDTDYRPMTERESVVFLVWLIVMICGLLYCAGGVVYLFWNL